MRVGWEQPPEGHSAGVAFRCGCQSRTLVDPGSCRTDGVRDPGPDRVPGAGRETAVDPCPPRATAPRSGAQNAPPRVHRAWHGPELNTGLEPFVRPPAVCDQTSPDPALRSIPSPGDEMPARPSSRAAVAEITCCFDPPAGRARATARTRRGSTGHGRSATAGSARVGTGTRCRSRNGCRFTPL